MKLSNYEKEFFFNEEQTKCFCRLLLDRYDTNFHDISIPNEFNTFEITDSISENFYEFLMSNHCENKCISILTVLVDKKDNDNRCYVTIKNNVKPYENYFNFIIVAPHTVKKRKTFQDVVHIAEHMVFLKNIDFFELL